MNENKKPGRLETMFKSRTYRNQLEKKIKEARKELRRFDRAVSSATRLQKKYDNRISQLREAADDISYELGLGTTDADKLLYMEERIKHVADEFPNNHIVFNGKIIMAFKKIKKSKNAHAQRIRLKTKPFYQRLLLAINMYKKGIYQNHFNGIQSLLRDVIFK